MVNSLSVFFPAYNEQGNIKATVLHAINILDKYHFLWEIIIIDDGSTDKTGKIADSLVRRSPKIRVVHQKNGGYGKALQTGFSTARYEWVVYSDADRQFDFSQIDKFLLAADSSDAVWGYRFKRQDSLLRFFTGLVWIWSLRLLLGITLQDVNCGFKMIKKKVLDQLGSLVSTRGAMINAELAIKIKQNGFKIIEIGVSHQPRISGTPSGVNLSVIMQSYWELVKFRFPFFLPIIGTFLASFLLPFTYWPEMLNWPFFINRGWLPYKDIIIVHTPLLPYTLIWFYNIFGFTTQSLHLFGSLLLAIMVYLVAKNVSNVTKSIETGNTVGLLFAFFAFSFSGNHVWFESFLTPFLLAIFYLQFRYLREKNPWLLFAAGLLLSLAFLTKQTTLYIVPASLIFLIKERRYSIFFVTPLILVFSLVFLFLTVQGTWPDFFHWAIRFVFFKPFLNRPTDTFTLLPNIRQGFLLTIFFSTAFFSLWKNRQFWVLSAVIWMIFSLLFSFPRFDYFHLIPALAFFSIAISPLVVKQKFLVIFLVLIAALIFWKNISYYHSFLDPKEITIADTINKSYSNKSLLVINGPDQLYFLTNRLPANKPWLPQLPWYFSYYGDGQFLNDIQKPSAEIVVFQPYQDKSVDGLGAYHPTNLEKYLQLNYRIVKVFDDGVKLLEKI